MSKDFFEALRRRARLDRGEDRPAVDYANYMHNRGIDATIEALKGMLVIPPQPGKMYINVDDNPREIDVVTVTFVAPMAKK